ncbi:MAG TPA: DUF1489 family protein [Micavibrio sp.]|nr:DUF1489 family protein [Micavibrio sp.]
MPIHLLKTAAGLQEIDQLIARQSGGKMRYDDKAATYAYTRYMPKRAVEIVDGGGSIYWILKNRIAARQKIFGFEMVQEEGEKDWCRIVVDPQLYLTIAKPKRAIQGWRYLEGKDAPKDRGPYFAGLSDNEPPPEMAEELRKAGLL